MAELGRGDVPIAILVKVTQAFNEVICSVNWALTGDGLHDGQEHLEADALIYGKKMLLVTKECVRLFSLSMWA